MDCSACSSQAFGTSARNWPTAISGATVASAIKFQNTSSLLIYYGAFMRDTTIGRDQIAAAALKIGPYIRRTPVIEVDGHDLGLNSTRLVLKLELFQHTGSFKTRGAFNNLLTREIPASGVVAASGGNHGAAVAYAARAVDVPARIFVPTVSSPAKIARIRGYGADLVIEGGTYTDALEASQA